MAEEIRKRMEAALADPDVTEKQTDAFVAMLRENESKAKTHGARSYVLCVGLSAIFALVVFGGVEKVTLLGTDVNTSNPAVLLALVLSAFCYYRALSLLALGDLIGAILQVAYRRRMGAFEKHRLTSLLTVPTLLDIEYSLFWTSHSRPSVRAMARGWIAMSFS